MLTRAPRINSRLTNPDPAFDAERYRNALMWAIDYFSASGLTDKERATGIIELGNVLLGRSSRAATYVPNEWDDSTKLVNR